MWFLKHERRYLVVPSAACLSELGLPGSLCPLTATLTTLSSSPTANCSKLTRSLSSFRDTGKQNFLADVSKSSMPFGIVI